MQQMNATTRNRLKRQSTDFLSPPKGRQNIGYTTNGSIYKLIAASDSIMRQFEIVVFGLLGGSLAS
jgi:hypothetical protein